MNIAKLIGMAVALGGVALPSLALADDPNDPAMRSATARARDKEMIRRLNLQEAARVRDRDARYAQGWSDTQDYGTRSYQGGDGDYAQSRADYQRELAQWRRAVAACRAGDYSYCAR